MTVNFDSRHMEIAKRIFNVTCVVVALIVYCINKVLLIQYAIGYVQEFCSSYLNDLVCPLFVIGVSQILFSWAGCEIKKYISLVTFVMSCGFVWEYFAPLINPGAVSDPWDLLCYFVGANIYYLLYKLCVNIVRKIDKTPQK